MKSNHTRNYVLLPLLFMLALPAVTAQNRSAEQEKQKQMQQELLKDMQEDEMKARKEMLDQQQQKMAEAERRYAEQATILDRQARETVRSAGLFGGGEYLIGVYGQENQSQLTLRKAFRETTNTSSGQFDVEPGIKHFRCVISGSVKSGEIFIGINYPNGKTFKELTINSSADINFSQSIAIKEGEEKKYSGTWNYVIKADKAEGNYMVQIMTN